MVCLSGARIQAQVYCDSLLAGKTISSIVIHGNEKTKASIILREMAHQTGGVLDRKVLEEDRKRIENLHLFNRVMIFCEPDGESVLIRVVVTEQWYLIPFPILFINDKDWSKWSYGAGLTYNNFRGRAESLALTFWLGYDPAVNLDYFNPWIGGKLNLFTGLGFSGGTVRSKYQYEANIKEKFARIRWTFGKRFGLFIASGIILEYKEITFSPSPELLTLSPSGRDRLPALGLYFVWDRRDLKEYPHAGWYASLIAQKTGWPSLEADFAQYTMDLRGYIPLRSATFALRTAFQLSSGVLPVYARTYLGYSERIRGHFFEIGEGENRALASIAFRFPLLPIFYFDIADTPELSDLKFGISFGLFFDAGLTWFQKDTPRADMLMSGYGAGIHVHLPYVHLFRLEFAINEMGQTQWIADLAVDI